MERQAILRKVIRAGSTGIAVAALNFVTLWILVHFLGPKISFSIAFLVGLAAHFILSKFWTFGDRSPAWKEQIPQYLFVAAVSYVIQLGVFQGAMSFLGLAVFAANLVAVAVGAVVGFVLMHNWVFSTRR